MAAAAIKPPFLPIPNPNPNPTRSVRPTEAFFNRNRLDKLCSSVILLASDAKPLDLVLLPLLRRGVVGFAKAVLGKKKRRRRKRGFGKVMAFAKLAFAFAAAMAFLLRFSFKLF